MLEVTFPPKNVNGHSFPDTFLRRAVVTERPDGDKMVVQKPPGNSWSSPHTIHLLAVKTWLLRAILNQSATVPGFISLNPRCCKEQRMFFFHGSILMGPSFSVPVHSYSMSLSSMNLIILCLRHFKQIRHFLNNKKLTNEMFKNIMVLTLRMYLE